MDDIYVDIILDHYKNPRHVGVISVSEGESKLRHVDALNAGCGDSIHADIVTHDGIITDIKWQGTGCAISTASMSMCSELVIGKSFEEVRTLQKEDMLTLLGLSTITPSREKCLLLPLQLFL